MRCYIRSLRVPDRESTDVSGYVFVNGWNTQVDVCHPFRNGDETRHPFSVMKETRLPADANCEMIAYGGGKRVQARGSRARFYNRLAENEQQRPCSARTSRSGRSVLIESRPRSHQQTAQDLHNIPTIS